MKLSISGGALHGAANYCTTNPDLVRLPPALAWQGLWPQNREVSVARLCFRIFRLDSGPYNDVLGHVSDPPEGMIRD
jgi:hypothetical protein